MVVDVVVVGNTLDVTDKEEDEDVEEAEAFAPAAEGA